MGAEVEAGEEAASPPLSVVCCPLSDAREEVLHACREPGFGESAWDRAAGEEAASPPLSVVGCQLSVGLKRAASPPLSVVCCQLSVGLKRRLRRRCPLSVRLKWCLAPFQAL